jgi:hypothetical protein
VFIVIGDVLKRGFWLLLVAAIAVAVIRGVPSNPNEWTNWGKNESGKVADLVEENIQKIDIKEYFDWDLNSIVPKNSDSSSTPKNSDSPPTSEENQSE